MSLLHYSNLPSVRKADILLKNTVFNLGNHYNFLNKQKKYLESSKAIKYVKWEEITEFEENFPKSQEGVWVQLCEPHHQSGQDDFEATLKFFLDESNTSVYEANQSNWQLIGQAVTECPSCINKSSGTPKRLYPTQSYAQEEINRSGRSLKIYECPHHTGWHLSKDIFGKYIQFKSDNKIEILGRDPEKEWLLLERLPKEEILVLRPNTYQIQCQINAIQALRNHPKAKHLPLLRLFEGNKYAKWVKEIEFENEEQKWLILTDDSRAGTDEQRDFVEVALNTPDFAILEGPPGSGKTTAICELILQLTLRGKRVLLCASTHVAVDNVLERLMSDSNPHREQILPIRIGDNANLSDKVKDYQLTNFLKTEKQRLLSHLRETKPLSKAQKLLQEQLNKGNQMIERMVLDSANLVCGTTIGILQHPDIKGKGRQEPQFDVMIIDEASKTTFQEFLVPALLAERWILVGDPKQLSPYVDDEALAVNVETCLPENYKREACLDVFLAGESMRNRATPLVITDKPQEIDFYLHQAKYQGVLIGSPKTPQYLPFSQIVIGDEDFFTAHQENLPLDIAYFRPANKVPDSIQRKHKAYCNLSNNEPNSSYTTWENEVSWRLARWYEQRLNNEIGSENKTSEKLEKALKRLLPAPNEDGKNATWDNLNKVRKVALPSILELLQQGFERQEGQRDGTALTDGLPSEVLETRLITLSNQHRMHPDIAEFSHKFIYQNKALFSPSNMAEKRAWGYAQQKRVIWHDVVGKKDNFNSNKQEVEAMIKELQKFDEWAKSNPNTNGEVWEVALLTFYRGQERALRQALRKWTGHRKGFRYFHRKQGQQNYLDIQICTVDRFQGHEADYVFLSFASPHATSFLESPNRLNVAITRARYQLKVFGLRQGLMKSSGVLGEFVKFVSAWDKTI
ncbi:AAA domain-containing protein [Pasteurella multocida]|uniref:AAA domain-containing protein n=1 Tax=Pasteurella multocida TaxID=747 RepID=UPI0032FB93B8|nr:AAA family ATPase [Pasteurella multocida]HDR1168630.1 AAA family ATPase [Pasteurella multocida]HDR1174897.1 AAA family ATPase [Pasteurella multocida]